MSILGCFMFRMIKNNNELGSLSKFDRDIYDLDKNEEEILNKFMENVNRDKEDMLKSSGREGKNIDIFPQNLKSKIDDSTLEYDENNKKIILTTQKKNEITRKREILFKLNPEKIILIPTFTFQDKARKNK